MSSFEIIKKLAKSYFGAALLQTLFVFCFMERTHYGTGGVIFLFFWALPVLALFLLFLWFVKSGELRDAAGPALLFALCLGPFTFFSLLQFWPRFREKKLSHAWSKLSHAWSKLP